MSNAVTLVRGDRIVCAGSAGECLVPKGARVVDGQGQYLIPGLIDSHVHLLFIVNGSVSEQMDLDLRDLSRSGRHDGAGHGRQPRAAPVPGARDERRATGLLRCSSSPAGASSSTVPMRIG